MMRPTEVYLALRYLRARQRNLFVSIFSLISIVGLAIGVVVLITVLSVMNGFGTELKQRILGMTAHITILDRAGGIDDWQRVADDISATAQVSGAAPFVRGEGMLTHRGAVAGVQVRGIDPALEPRVSFVTERLIAGRADALEPGRYRVLLGKELAVNLRARVGDMVTLVAPEPTTTAAGIVPRLRRFEVAGVFEVGHHQYDANLAVVHMRDAARLFRLGDGVSGIRLRVDDIYRAPLIRSQLQLPPRLAAIDWTQYHVNVFKALKTEKLVMFVILTLIVAIAAINIVSTGIMVVTEKRAEIAILRTIGMTPGGVTRVFIYHGLIIGLIGTCLGVLGGIALATNLESIVAAIEGWFGVQFMPSDVYYISEVPSEVRVSDVVATGLTAFTLAVLATLFPALQAARTQPARALRYE